MAIKNFISINDFTSNEIFNILVPASREWVPIIRGRKLMPEDHSKKVVMLFFEPSTRTKSSYWEAARFLGWEREIVSSEEASSLAKKESIANTARMYALYNTDVLVIRTKIEGAQKFAAEILEREGYEVSVQNAGDGTNQHPTQTLLDLLTIDVKIGRFDDLTIGFWGDLNFARTVHSMLNALSHRRNIKIVLVSPKETSLQLQYKKKFSDVVEGDSLELLAPCDIVYGSRFQLERHGSDMVTLNREMKKFQLNSKALGYLKKDGVIILHPLPYDFEISPEIRKDKRVIVDDQAWCGVPTRTNCLSMGYENKGRKAFGNLREKCEMEVVRSIGLDEYLEERHQKKIDKRYFYPITNGTVIDHIPRGLAPKIRSYLYGRFSGQGVKHIIEDVPSQKQIFKDVLVFEDMFLDEGTTKAILSFAPTITLNIIKDGKFEKLRLSNPAIIEGIGVCPNTNCITNKDPEAKPKFIGREEGPECFYCEKQFTREEVLI